MRKKAFPYMQLWDHAGGGAFSYRGSDYADTAMDDRRYYGNFFVPDALRRGDGTGDSTCSGDRQEN